MNRLAANSFQLKQWSITLLVALLFLLARDNSGLLILIGLLPVLVFWCLDGYFLRQERLFRDLYNRTILVDEHEITFAMKLDMKSYSWWGAFWSTTLRLFYLALAIAIVAVAITDHFYL